MKLYEKWIKSIVDDIIENNNNNSQLKYLFRYLWEWGRF